MLHGAWADHPRVAEVLAAAALPARTEELTGEDAALAAFREAREQDAVPAMRRSRLRSLLARPVPAIGAAALGVAVLAAAGVFSGTLPDPLAIGYGREPAPAPHATASARNPNPAQRQSPPGGPTPGQGARSGRPAPSMVGPCRAYWAKVDTPPRKGSGTPASKALVSAAGGADKVAAYCAAVRDGGAEKPGKGGKGPGQGRPGTSGRDDRGGQGDDHGGGAGGKKDGGKKEDRPVPHG